MALRSIYFALLISVFTSLAFALNYQLEKAITMRHLCSACRADNQPDKPEMDNLGTDCSGPAWSIRSANKCSEIFTNIVNTLAPLLSDETVIELTTLVTMMAGNNFTQYGLYGQEKRTGIDPMYGVVVG